jgi:hypothetical protein
MIDPKTPARIDSRIIAKTRRMVPEGSTIELATETEVTTDKAF